MTDVAHPAADLFPLLPEDQLRELARDIERNGLRHPICLWNGMIVDGRTRARAIAKTNRVPEYQEMDFKNDAECVRYIISTNIHRRHLTESQRAMIASELAKLGRGGDHTSNAQIKALTQDEAAEQMQVSRSSVQAARKVQEQAPDLAAKVKSGELKVSKAASIAKERSRPTQPATDPDRADDAVVDAKIERASNGYTPKMEKVWAAYSALDAVEQTAFRERMNA